MKLKFKSEKSKKNKHKCCSFKRKQEKNTLTVKAPIPQNGQTHSNN